MGRFKGFLYLLSLTSYLLLAACQGDEQPTFSLLPGEEVFEQDTVIDNRVDIVWVIDNSGSMANLQTQLATNFSAFISDFVNQGYDYKMAVTNTEAWKAPFDGDPEMARFRDGDGTTSSGEVYITPDSVDPIATFQINVTQGINGDGDERPFQSMREVLESPLNSDFYRPEAFLAVIIVTDEDDFSTDTDTFLNEDYDHPDIHPVQDYVDFLDTYTQAPDASNRRYSVSGITINDQTCLDSNTPWGNIAQRVQELVTTTEGVIGDVCSDNFSETLNDIQLKINTLATQFKIERELIPGSIEVIVDGVVIAEDDSNGWSYNSETQVLRFYGSAIPAQGAQIVVNYEPVTIK